MSDACCGVSDEPVPEDLAPWWRDQALALPAAAGVLWLTGLLLGVGGSEGMSVLSYAVGLAAGAWTFAPAAIRRLVTGRGQGRLGVGLLMTIAGTGAVLLGHVGEAAALAFLALLTLPWVFWRAV
ncbi:hypothetical protein ABC138_16930, partial [Janibacter sp. LM]